MAGFRFDTRPQGQSVDQRVKRQTQKYAQPTQFVRASVMMVVLGMRVMLMVTCLVVIVFPLLAVADYQLCWSMLMKVKRADQEKHAEQPDHHPPHSLVDGPEFCVGVRQHVKDADAEHQPTHQADHHLGSCVCESNPVG